MSSPSLMLFISILVPRLRLIFGLSTMYIYWHLVLNPLVRKKRIESFAHKCRIMIQHGCDHSYHRSVSQISRINFFLLLVQDSPIENYKWRGTLGFTTKVVG